MANTKISALTSASTPLAGTETLPIVQSSTTKQVSVANLTAGRSVAAKDLTLDSSGGTLATMTRTGISGLVIGADNAGPLFAPTTINAIQVYNAAQSVQQFVLNTSNGNFVALTGNIVINTSGKGIDFSATPGTGTSELLADYEEGTYTATLTCQTSGTITVNSSFNTLAYTKIGRVVYIQGGIRVSAVSSPLGAITLNLPFTSANLSQEAGLSVGIAIGTSIGTYSQPFAMYVTEGGTDAYIQYMNLGSRASVQGTDFSGNEEIQFGFSYIAA
jgi:hypothetical protein